MLDKEKILLHIIGFGRHAETRILPAVQTLGIQSVTVVTSRAAEFFSLKEKPSVSLNFISPQEFLSLGHSDEKLKIAWIANDNVLHKEWIEHCVQKGFHVLCEKPLCLTAADAIACNAISRDTLIVEAFMYRHAEYIPWLKKKLFEFVGKPHLITVHFGYCKEDLSNSRLQKQRGGGALNDIGCYGVDFARLMLDEGPEHVTANSLYGSQSGVDETTSVTMIFKSGCVVNINVSTHIEPVNRVDIAGPKGRVLIEDAFVRTGPQQRILVISEGQENTYDFSGQDLYAVQLERFIGLVGGVETYDLMENGISNAKCLDKIRMSASSRKIVCMTSYPEPSC